MHTLFCHKRIGPRSILAAVALLAFLSAGCSSQPPEISIDGQYGELSPVFFGVASVFMTIRNSGGGDAVTGISVNVPGAIVELHDVKGRRMVKVEKIAVPSRGSAQLKPGGLHIMVFNMPKAMREGSEIVLTLSFAHSSERKVSVRLDKPKEPPDSQH